MIRSTLFSRLINCWDATISFYFSRFQLVFLALLGFSHHNLQAQSSESQPLLPDGVEQSWWSRAQQHIRDSEYHVTQQKEGLQAPNRAHNLRTWFDESGPLTVSRGDAAPESGAWQWGLQLARLGWKDGDLSHVAPAAAQAHENMVTYQRGESLREWYVNDSSGLRSWHKVEQAPAGSGDTLRLELAIRGNTHAAMSVDGQTIEFLAPGGEHVINYGGLKAWDASGRELACRLGVEGMEAAARVVLDISASGAVFPLIIDPLATSAAWTAESDQASARFGSSVASAGDVNGDGYSDVIVGAYGYDNGQTDEGRAYVYLGGGPAGVNEWFLY